MYEKKGVHEILSKKKKKHQPYYQTTNHPSVNI